MAARVSAHVLRLYQQFPLQMTHTAKISGVMKDTFGWLVRLNETIFHPKGGGQLNDQGTINGIAVKVVTNAEGNEINHYLEADDCPFSEGEEVSLVIDSEKRKEYTALHSAGHVLAALAETRFPQIYATKAHHYPGEAKVSFKQKAGNTAPFPTKALVQLQLAQDMEAAIKKRISIKVLLDESGRRIQVDTYAPVGCGGTHLEHAGQISDFSIRSVAIKKGELNIGYNASYKEEKPE